MDVDNEWELSKENVQPLRSGRRMGDLREALKKDNAASRNAIQEFEMELRRTKSDAEMQLDVWYNYISWMQQHFATSNKETVDLMNRCVQYYKGSKELNQNEKYVHIWIKLSEQMDEPDLIYDYLFDQDIGTSLAMFYKSWAEYSELVGSSQKADELYTLGINRGAEPVDLLVNCRRLFENRMAKKLENEKDNSSPQNQQTSRKVLGGLKVGRSGKVGNERSRNEGNASRINVSHGSTTNHSNKGFVIYGDKNPSASALHTGGTCQINDIPVDSSLLPENRQNMEKLKGAKVKQTGSTGSKSTKFEIYAEEDQQPEDPTPRKVVVSARKPLSMKKEKTDPYKFYDPKNISSDTTVITKYCKNIIYMGAKEVSFDELKAQLPKYSEPRTAAVRSISFDNIQVANDKKHENSRKITKDLSKLVEESFELDKSQNTNKVDRFVDDLDHMEIKCSARSDLTMMLNNISEHDTIGFPNCESTAFVKLNKSGKPNESYQDIINSNNNKHFTAKYDDIHMQTPDKVVKSEQNKMSKPMYGDILSELNQTEIIDNKGNIADDMELGVVPLTYNNCMDELDMTQNFASFQTSQKNEIDTHNNISGKVQNVTKQVENNQTVEQHYEADELKQLKQLSALSGVTLDIFGDNNLKLDTDMENDFFTSQKVGNMAGNKQQNDSLIGQLKLLSPFDSFGITSEPPPTDEFQFQEPIIPKTPKSNFTSGLREQQVNNDNLWAPSPTVNTKNAKSNVESMFSLTLDQEKFDVSLRDQTFEAQFGFNTSPKEHLGSVVFHDEQAPPQVPKGFSIFSDVKNEEQNEPLAQKGFSIYSETLETNPDPYKKPQGFSIFNDTTQQQVSKPKEAFQIYRESDISQKQISEQLKDIAHESKPKSGFSVYSDEDRTGNLQTSSSHHNNASRFPVSVTMLEETMACGDMPKRPVSTPFSSNCDMQSVTFDHNFSNITSGVRLGKTYMTDTSSLSHTAVDLSVIQERSNEEDKSHENDDIVIDAFDPELRLSWLNNVAPQISSSDNFLNVYGPLPHLQGASVEIQLGPRRIRIMKCILKGGLSATYKAVNNLNQSVSLKISKGQDIGLLWDFYISNEIHKRLSAYPDHYTILSPNFIKHNMLCKYSDSICLESLYYSEGTLQDLIDLYKKYNTIIDEPLAMLYAHKILNIIHTLHKLDILHADLKPENFIQADCELTNAGPFALQCLKLKGFNKSIDMTQSDSKGAMLIGSNQADSFSCREMRENKTWKYQVDYFAAAGTIHVILFQNFMNTYIDPKTNMLCICNTPRSDWNVELWSNLLSTLINSNHEDTLPALINELARELNEPEMIEKLDEAILKKSDLLMNDD